MKKILCIIAAILLVASSAMAIDWAKSSGQQTADALIYTGSGYFHGIIVSSDSANAITVDIYDGTTATGTKLIPTTVVTTSAIDRIQAIKPPAPVLFFNGIYVDITCSGTAKYVVYFY
jgi:hypothetical protein